ncbi:hypothetical protein GCM10028803_43090 [Larkinella knui]|uniref:RHS repeat protein n=1 Tax=Larkinella knui TaxID=2025310 RepID=A0A3P1CPG0_9BACT|nr:hypothetical protein [Larkinella knui]RRB14936.1 hypothetical protein EHT87_10235 [Larkinella knui]
MTDHRSPVDPQGRQFLLTHISEVIGSNREYSITYNAAAQPTSATVTYSSGGQVTNSLKEMYIYNLNGKLIQTVRGGNPELPGSAVSFMNYTYDSNGRTTSRSRIIRDIFGVTKTYWIEKYEHDNQNRINKIIRDYYFDQDRTNQYGSTIFFTEVETLQFDARNNIITIDLVTTDAVTKQVILRGQRLNQFDDKPNPLYDFDLFEQAFFRFWSPNNLVRTQAGVTKDLTIPLNQIIKTNQVSTIQYANGLPISEADNFGISRTFTYSPR